MIFGLTWFVNAVSLPRPDLAEPAVCFPVIIVSVFRILFAEACLKHADGHELGFDDKICAGLFAVVDLRELLSSLSEDRTHLSSFLLRNLVPVDLAHELKCVSLDRAYTPPGEAVLDVFGGGLSAAAEALGDDDGALAEHLFARAVRHPSVTEVIEQGLHRACRVENIRRGCEDEEVCFEHGLLNRLNFSSVLAEILPCQKALCASDTESGAVFGQVEFRYLGLVSERG